MLLFRILEVFLIIALTESHAFFGINFPFKIVKYSLLIEDCSSQYNTKYFVPQGVFITQNLGIFNTKCSTVDWNLAILNRKYLLSQDSLEGTLELRLFDINNSILATDYTQINQSFFQAEQISSSKTIEFNSEDLYSGVFTFINKYGNIDFCAVFSKNIIK